MMDKFLELTFNGGDYGAGSVIRESIGDTPCQPLQAAVLQVIECRSFTHGDCQKYCFLATSL